MHAPCMSDCQRCSLVDDLPCVCDTAINKDGFSQNVFKLQKAVGLPGGVMLPNFH